MVQSASTTSAFSFNAIKGCTINVLSNGEGDKRGILVNGTNIVTVRDTNVYVAAPPTDDEFPGSYVGVETNDATNPAEGSIQLRTTSIAAIKPTGSQNYTSSDILQTRPAQIADPTYLASPGIQIGPGVDLVTKSAGGQPFTTYTYPTTLFYGGKGTASNNIAGYLWPGTVTFAGGGNPYPDTTTPAARYRIQQPLILSGIQATCNAISVGHTVVITVCKNAAVGNALSNPTPFTVTLTNAVQTAAFYNASVDFAAGEYINLYINVTGNTLHDLAVQLDLL
jgi:hypothetical protein